MNADLPTRSDQNEPDGTGHGPLHRRRAILSPLVLMVVLSIVLGTTATPAASRNDRGRPARVLIVSIPRLTWEDLVDDAPPNLRSFFDDAAVGNTSLRTIGPRTSLGAAYVTIGSGNRAGVSNADAGRVLQVRDRFENGTAAQAFERRTGREPGSPIIHLSIESILARNDRYLYGALPGSLGTALVDAGLTPAVVANADTQAATWGEESTDPLHPTGEPPDDAGAELPALGAGTTQFVEPVQSENRPAGMALMTRGGEIAGGAVDRSLLVADEEAPFGVVLDHDRIVDRTADSFEDDSVVLVELSDLERADWYRPRTDRRQGRRLRDRALEHSDRIFGDLLDLTGPDDLVVVISPVAPRSGETLTPTAVRGESFRSGLLTSGTTRRPGYISLPDIAPMILDTLGIEKPVAMSGSPIRADNDGDLSVGRYERFSELNRATRFRDTTVDGIIVGLVVLQVVFCALALYTIVRKPTLGRRARSLAIFTASVPVSSFLLGLLPFERWGGAWFAAALVLVSVALAAVSIASARLFPERHRSVAPMLLPLVLTWLLLTIDIVTGGHLQLNTVFGYSPVVAGRFAGFGNPAYSLYAMAAVVIAGLAWRFLDGDDRRRRPALLIGLSILFLVTVVLDGHPSFGSDVGGVLSIIPTAMLVLWLLCGRRVTVRAVLIAAAVTAIALVGFAALDLARPAADQTHLARLVHTTFGDEGGGIGTILQRKLNANLGILRRSSWTWSIPLALLLLAQLTRRREQWMAGPEHRADTTNAILWGGLTMCVTGMAVNDSGIAIPAVMFTLLIPTIVCLAVAPYLAPAGAVGDATPSAGDHTTPPPDDGASPSGDEARPEEALR